MDPRETRLIELFFTGDSLKTTISVLAQQSKHNDPITYTILVMLSTPVQIQLTAVGLQPFQSKECTIPYFNMSESQREFLRGILFDKSDWNIYENALGWKRKGDKQTLPTLDVLKAMCSSILNTSVYEDKRLRLAACNIILQKIQASNPLAKNVQAQLNEDLFS